MQNHDPNRISPFDIVFGNANRLLNVPPHHSTPMFPHAFASPLTQTFGLPPWSMPESDEDHQLQRALEESVNSQQQEVVDSDDELRHVIEMSKHDEQPEATFNNISEGEANRQRQYLVERERAVREAAETEELLAEQIARLSREDVYGRREDADRLEQRRLAELQVDDDEYDMELEKELLMSLETSNVCSVVLSF